jgi:hypothetical protein
MNMKVQCKNCAWFVWRQQTNPNEAVEGGDYGECHWRPPKIFTAGGGRFISIWTTVRAETFCGQGQFKDAGEPANTTDDDRVPRTSEEKANLRDRIFRRPIRKPSG